MLGQRSQVANGGATGGAVDYSFKHCQALTRFIDDGMLPIGNNWIAQGQSDRRTVAASLATYGRPTPAR